MPDRSAGPPERIAIVADDSAIIRDNVRYALGSRWQIFVAANGKEALEFARTTRPLFILLDARMPRMDGIEACRQIRDLPHCSAVPIMILTAYDEPLLRRRANRAGVTCVAAKPFTFESLRGQIGELLRQHGPAATIDTDPDQAGEGSGRLDDREALDVCRRVEAAADAIAYNSFAEAMQALHKEDRY